MAVIDNSTNKESPKSVTDYAGLISSNPYDKYEYKNGWWDTIGDGLGFRTGQDSVREEYAKASREYDAQVAQLQFENYYNSEQQKVERMRAAGLNPDLLGIDGASESSEFAMEQTSPDTKGSAVTGQEVMNGLMNVVTTAFGLYSNMQNLGITKDLNEINLFDKMFGITDDLVKRFKPYEGNDNEEREAHNRQIATALNGIGDLIFGRKRNNLRYKLAVGRSLDSVKNTLAQYKDMKELQDKRFDYGVDAGYKGNISESDEAIQTLVKPFSMLAKEHFRLQLLANNKKFSASIAESKYQTDFYNASDGSVAGKSNNAVNIFAKQNAEFKYNLNKQLSASVAKLSRLAEHGNHFAQALLFGFAAQTNGMIPELGIKIPGMPK